LMRTGKVYLLVLAVFLALCFSLSDYCLAQQAAPQAKAKEAQAKPQPERVVAAPQNIRESSHIYVFVGWMWVSIAVLIYFLRLKVKESDRLYEIKYFSPDRK
jgi:cytochrome c biogenesis factor